MLKAQDGRDIVRQGPHLYLATQKRGAKIQEVEQPIFHWTFSELGALSTAFNKTTDVVITNGRVYLWSRQMYKPFECSTSLQYLCCHCGWFSKLTHASGLTHNASFFMLPQLLSFSTTTDVQPPLWSDPTHMPLKVPLITTICDTLTNLILRKESEPAEDSSKGLSLLPRRNKPRVQLFLMWRLKASPQMAELIASIRPFRMKDFEDTDSRFSLVVEEAQPETGEMRMHKKKMQELRAIMGIAQDVAAGWGGGTSSAAQSAY